MFEWGWSDYEGECAVDDVIEKAWEDKGEDERKDDGEGEGRVSVRARFVNYSSFPYTPNTRQMYLKA